MKVTYTLAGLKELDAALGELPKATGKNILRRVLRKAGQPIADEARQLAPRDTGELLRSIGVGTQLTRRQRAQHRRMFRDDRASVEMFVGPGGLAQAVTQEFGTYKEPAQPFMRPAWDANKMKALGTIKLELEAEIDKAAKRMARKAARAARKAARG